MYCKDEMEQDAQESVFVLVFFVDRAHERSRGRQHLINKDKDGLLGRQLDAFANDIDKLAAAQER